MVLAHHTKTIKLIINVRNLFETTTAICSTITKIPSRSLTVLIVTFLQTIFIHYSYNSVAEFRHVSASSKSVFDITQTCAQEHRQAKAKYANTNKKIRTFPSFGDNKSVIAVVIYHYWCNNN